MHQIIKHFTDDDLYKFTMCCAVIDNFPRAQVKYQFADRNNTAYPAGFAELVMEQVKMLESVVITDEEISFIRSRCSFIPQWFCTYLRGFRYSSKWVKAWQDDEGHLSIEFEGSWADTILLEVKVLAIISELYYEVTGQTDKLDYEKHYERSYEKGMRLLGARCKFSDFGTRRRASFEAEDTLVRAMVQAHKHYKEVNPTGAGTFVGTSNVYLAMKHDIMPIGTMAHEFVCAIAAMFGPMMANNIAMSMWAKTYRGALGTYLYDTYGWDIFSLNFSEDYANMFKGLRVDSGDNYEQLQKIVAKYRSLGIDPLTKQVIFSNGLNTDEAIAIQHYATQYCMPSFGIGTHFTNDFPGIEPMNIVIKLVAAKITESWTFYNDTCKMSEDRGKYTGKPEVVKRFKDALHIDY